MKIFPRTALATSTALFLHAGAATAALEEVVVTATKRAESIQDVPVSVTAVSSDVMQKLNITDVEDLTAIVPNFEINSAAVIPNLYIRGIGGGLAHSIEQTVGRFIDEVYISRAAINLHPFLDVAAVEVLRGPQGTLFGKNTAAGAMIIHTNDPTDDFEAGFNLSYGEYDTTGSVGEVNGFISGGLSDNVSGRLAFIYKDKDGFYENQLNGPDGAEREDYGLQGKLRFDLSDQTRNECCIKSAGIRCMAVFGREFRGAKCCNVHTRSRLENMVKLWRSSLEPGIRVGAHWLILPGP